MQLFKYPDFLLQISKQYFKTLKYPDFSFRYPNSFSRYPDSVSNIQIFHLDIQIIYPDIQRVLEMSRFFFQVSKQFLQISKYNVYPEYRISKLQDIQNTRYPEYRISRIQDIKNTGYPEYRISRIQDIQNTEDIQNKSPKQYNIKVQRSLNLTVVSEVSSFMGNPCIYIYIIYPPHFDIPSNVPQHCQFIQPFKT